MLKITPIVFLLFISFFAQSQENENSSEFSKILTDYSMEFKMPSGFSETELIENPDLYYYYAIKHDSIKLEIRYSFYFTRDEIARNKESDGIQADPNKMYMALTTTNQLNLSGGNEYHVTRFNQDSVQNEFGADEGGSTFFPLNSKFGTGFEYCMMTVLHKEDVADAFVLFLFDDQTIYQDYLQEAFYSLKFKQ